MKFFRSFAAVVAAFALVVPAAARAQTIDPGARALAAKAASGNIDTLSTRGQYLGNMYMPAALVAKLAKMADGNTVQANYVYTGDSVAGNTSAYITTMMKTAFGVAGYGLDYAGGTIVGAGLTNVLSGGAYQLDGTTYPFDYTRWLTGLYTVLPSPGARIEWGVGGGYQLATKLKVYYVKEPGAGSFTFETNNNGAGWVT